jgi:hypothetical protein
MRARSGAATRARASRWLAALLLGAVLGPSLVATPARAEQYWIYWIQYSYPQSGWEIMRGLDSGLPALTHVGRVMAIPPLAPVPYLDLPRDLAVDPEDGLLFWSTMDTVERANLDGTGHVTVRGPETGEIYDVALDTGNDQLYWASEASQIDRCAYDGSNPIDVQSSQATMPLAISLDLVNDRLFWIERGLSIERSALGGGAVTTLYPYPVVNGGGLDLAVSGESGLLFWRDITNIESYMIRQGTTEGGPTALTLSTADFEISDVELASDELYWSGNFLWDTSGAVIFRGETPVWYSDSKVVYGLAVVPPATPLKIPGLRRNGIAVLWLAILLASLWMLRGRRGAPPRSGRA